MAMADSCHSDVNFAVVENAMGQLRKMNQFIETGMTACLDVALDLEESEDNPDQVNELKNKMLEYASMERDLSQFTQAIENVKDQIRKTPSDNVINVDQLVNHEMNTIQRSSIHDNLNQHPRVEEMRTKLWQVKHPGETEPSMANERDNMDEDLVMSQAPVITKCPITQQELVDPVKNKICDHNYERKAILHHMSGGRGRRKCPVAGCGNSKPVEKSDLEDNTVLKHTIERRNRQRMTHQRK
ncbi:E3 SUMO-protein ligase NSE2-like [Glandiceps talaboti]